MLNSVTNLSISLQNPKPIIGKSTPQGTALSFTAIFDSGCLIWWGLVGWKRTKSRGGCVLNERVLWVSQMCRKLNPLFVTVGMESAFPPPDHSSKIFWVLRVPCGAICQSDSCKFVGFMVWICNVIFPLMAPCLITEHRKTQWQQNCFNL